VPEELDRGIKEWDIDPGDVHERMRSGRARLHELIKIASIYSGVPEDESLSPYVLLAPPRFQTIKFYDQRAHRSGHGPHRF